MRTYFPSKTVEFKLEEPRAFRRFSWSLVEMAVVTGILLRAFRSLVLTHGSNSWLYLGGTWALGLVFLLFMATAHVANFPTRQWLWRAPAFVGIEWAAASATSALLIWIGREPNGTVRAEWHDWFGLSMNTLVWTVVQVLPWAALLALIVHLVKRSRLVREDVDPEAPEETPAA